MAFAARILRRENFHPSVEAFATRHARFDRPLAICFAHDGKRRAVLVQVKPLGLGDQAADLHGLMLFHQSLRWRGHIRRQRRVVIGQQAVRAEDEDSLVLKQLRAIAAPQGELHADNCLSKALFPDHALQLQPEVLPETEHVHVRLQQIFNILI